MKSCLNVFQRNNYVVIKINEEADFEFIQKEIKRKVSQLKKLYKEDKIPIKVIGKILKNKEIEQIEAIIKEGLGVDVEFDMPRELGLSNIKRTFASEISTSETKFHKGSLRSGQKIVEERSIVILRRCECRCRSNCIRQYCSSWNFKRLGTCWSKGQ